MQTIYCISGLGADEGVFQYLDLSFAKPVFIKWITPLPGETLPQYATRLREKFITEPDPLIIGLSLGGMLATEIAKQLPQAKVVIISSAKTKFELPFYWRMFKRVPVYKVLPFWLVKQSTAMQEYFLGANFNAGRHYTRSAVRAADMHFYKWALGAIITWANTVVPSNILHLHGEKDRLLPIRFVKADFVIKKGGHLMIIEHAGENSMLLKEIFAAKNKENELNLVL